MYKYCIFIVCCCFCGYLLWIFVFELISIIIPRYRRELDFEARELRFTQVDVVHSGVILESYHVFAIVTLLLSNIIY